MTLKQFEMHRPILFRRLLDMIGPLEDDAWSVMPSYGDDILFRAYRLDVDSDTFAVCVSPRHPMAMPGDQGTWWWGDELKERTP